MHERIVIAYKDLGAVLSSAPVATELEAKRRRGIPVDGNALDAHMFARGLEGQDLAKLARVSEDTVSRARNGGHVERNTLAKLAAALDAVPVNPALVKLVGLPGPAEKKNTDRGRRPIGVEEVNGVHAPDPAT